jgi:PPOX class probable F420-dependent enzyme
MTSFAVFNENWAVLLTTFRRDGTPVDTPVSLAIDGNRAYFRTPATAWKVKRIANNPRVELAPCTPRGRAVGRSLPAMARRLDGDEEKEAKRALRREHPVLQGLVVPLLHRLMRCGTAHYELRLA